MKRSIERAALSQSFGQIMSSFMIRIPMIKLSRLPKSLVPESSNVFLTTMPNNAMPLWRSIISMT